jgi:hypothetical protein
MVRPALFVSVVLAGDDVARLATRVYSLIGNLRRFEGLNCVSCEMARDEDYAQPVVFLDFEVPVRRRVWVSGAEPTRILDAARRWVNRWANDPSVREEGMVNVVTP